MQSAELRKTSHLFRPAKQETVNMVRYSVLIVDDDVQVLSTLAQFIESAGHNVAGRATTGEEAIH